MIKIMCLIFACGCIFLEIFGVQINRITLEKGFLHLTIQFDGPWSKFGLQILCKEDEAKVLEVDKS